MSPPITSAQHARRRLEWPVAIRRGGEHAAYQSGGQQMQGGIVIATGNQRHGPVAARHKWRNMRRTHRKTDLRRDKRRQKLDLWFGVCKVKLQLLCRVASYTSEGGFICQRFLPLLCHWRYSLRIALLQPLYFSPQLLLGARRWRRGSGAQGVRTKISVAGCPPSFARHDVSFKANGICVAKVTHYLLHAHSRKTTASNTILTNDLTAAARVMLPDDPCARLHEPALKNSWEDY
jgi:hypothetical protein